MPENIPHYEEKLDNFDVDQVLRLKANYDTFEVISLIEFARFLVFDVIETHNE